MNCLRRCADACCRASFFSPLLLFITVSHCFLFLFSCSKLPTSTTPQEFTSSQCTRLVPRCVYVFHSVLVCVYVRIKVFMYLWVWFSIHLLPCVFSFRVRFAHYRSLSLPLFCDLCSQKTQHILCFVLLLLSVRVCRRLKTGRLLPTTYTECAHYNAVCGAMRIFGQHLLTFVSSINFDLPYAAAASAAALLPLFVSPLCAFSNDKFVSFALSLQHTHTHTHIETLSLILCYGLSVKQYQPRSLARSLFLTHSMCCVRPRSLRAYSPLSVSPSLSHSDAFVLL